MLRQEKKNMNIYFGTLKFKLTNDRTPAANSTYKKLAVQWLIETFCFASRSLVADSFVLPCLPAGKEIASFL
jgi:hypothetical protein